ncbi:MAG: hypothetical protein U0518_00855 [Candidatus Gracilibacteria bacterium]
MTSSFFSSRSRSLQEDKQGFVAIIVVLLIGFLTVVTASLLWLFVEENKITRTLSSGIATQYGSEGALEYALLKKKHHDHGFEDTLKRDDACDISKVLRSDSGSIDIMSHSLKIGYEMKSQETSYTGTIAGGGYEIIPLYTDTGSASSLLTCSGLKTWSGSDTATFTKNFKLNLTVPSASTASTGALSWNILVSSGSETIGLAGTGEIAGPSSSGALRILNGTIGEQYVKDSPDTISNFLSGGTFTYTKPFLVLFNNQSDSIEYNLTSTSVGSASAIPFSSPKPCIYATAEVGRGNNARGQFYKFCQNNSDLLDGLKYSVFSK